MNFLIHMFLQHFLCSVSLSSRPQNALSSTAKTTHRPICRFDIIKKLGQGTYGKVQLGINKETSQEVAIKTIKKCKIETEADLVRIRREVQIMSSVQHPNIIHIYEGKYGRATSCLEWSGFHASDCHSRECFFNFDIVYSHTRHCCEWVRVYEWMCVCLAILFS